MEIDDSGAGQAPGRAAGYHVQHRGGEDAYERYLRGMDQSMRQKVALTAAHLLGQGTVADMGTGSGAGAFALASLYPRLRVVGVDVNFEMVTRATASHRLPNLEFRQGNIAERVFDCGSLDGIFNSSVLHHVTSFGGYDHEEAARALSNQARQLAVGGTLIVRDFVAPPGGDVLLDLPEDDGDSSDDPRRCSTAALFERFATEFRKLLEAPGFSYEQTSARQDQAAEPPRDGWRRYQVDHRLAVEFLLRKDYRRDWETEVLEEYTYFTQDRFEREFQRLGLRLLASIPIFNPWVIKNRLEGRCELRQPDGRRMPFPATNHLIVGERVPEGAGVRFEVGESVDSVEFLIRHCFALRDSGELRDLVRRRGTALDVIPWFTDGGALYVIARKGHPRPVLQADFDSVPLDGATAIGYVTEPILVLQTDKPVAFTVEAALKTVTGVSPETVKTLEEVATYYPSPGGLVEEVRAVHVEVEPTYVQRDIVNVTGFSTGGSVRAIDARQVLRAAQVGALPDARLELNVYELLRRRHVDPGPWLGSSIGLDETDGPEPVSFADCTLPQRRAYVPAPADTEAGFLRRECRLFGERDASGAQLSAQPLEYVVPAQLSCNTVACTLLRRHRGEVVVGLDEDDLAAAQCFSGSSALWVTPAWRLPRSVGTLAAAAHWVRERLQDSYGIEAVELIGLGGRYHPSAGVTPEVVYPWAVAAQTKPSLASRAQRQLLWVPLREVAAAIHRIQDGHLRIGTLRAAHALGLSTWSPT